MFDNTKFQVCLKFGVVDHFMHKKRDKNTNVSTNLTIQAVCPISSISPKTKVLQKNHMIATGLTAKVNAIQI